MKATLSLTADGRLAANRYRTILRAQVICCVYGGMTGGGEGAVGAGLLVAVAGLVG